MAEIWNLSALCRCCHKDGQFTDLRTLLEDSDTKNYETLLQDTFNISMDLPLFEASYAICDLCIDVLVTSYNFKCKVVKCEQKFQEYYRNELATRCDLKVEKESDNDDDNREPLHFINIQIPKEVKLEDKKDIIVEIPMQETVLTKRSKNYKKPKREDKKDSIVKTERRLVRKQNRLAKIVKKKSFTMPAKVSIPKTLYPELQKYITLEKNIGKCKLCDHIFTFANYLAHLRQKHDIKIEYKCNICHKVFNGEAKLKSHKNTHKETFQCKKCLKKYTDYDKLINHFLMHDQVGFICDLCGQNYKLKDHLRSHLQRKIVCELCAMWFNNKTSYIEHVCNNSKVGSFTCEICFAVCNTEHKFNSHKLTHKLHNLKDVFICKMCGEKFMKFNKYVNHYVKQHMKGGFRCDFCDKEFKFKMTVLKHLSLFHYGKSLKKAVCEFCGHSFNDKTMYLKHVRAVHENLRPFSCKLCPLTFKTASCLKVHIRRHTGERPYKCDVCDKAFVLQSYLNAHKKVHSTYKTAKRKKRGKAGVGNKDFEIEIDQFKSETAGQINCNVIKVKKY